MLLLENPEQPREYQSRERRHPESYKREDSLRKSDATLQRQIDRNSHSIDQLVEASARLQESVDRLVKHMHQSYTVADDISSMQARIHGMSDRITEIDTKIKTYLAVWGAILTGLISILQVVLKSLEITL